MERAESCSTDVSSTSEATVVGGSDSSAAKCLPSLNEASAAEAPCAIPADKAVLPELLVEPPSFHAQMVHPFSTRRRRKERLFPRQVFRPKRFCDEVERLNEGFRSESAADNATAASPRSGEGSSLQNQSPSPQSRVSLQQVRENHSHQLLSRRWLPASGGLSFRETNISTLFPPTQRVNQLDALRVNSELVLSLQQAFLQCFESVAPWLQRRHSEVEMALQTFLWAAFTLRNRPTPGDLLQNVKYNGCQQLQRVAHQQLIRNLQEETLRLARGEEALSEKIRLQERMILHAFLRSQKQHQQEQPLPLRCKLGILLLHVVLPYLYQKVREVLHRKRVEQQTAVEQRIRRYNILQAMKFKKLRTQSQQQQSNQDASAYRAHQNELGTSQTSLTPAEQTLEKLYRACMLVDFFLGLVRFLHFFAFLSRGRYRTVGDALLQLELTPIHPALRRNVSFELLQHEVFWQSASHVLLLLLPFIDILSIKRFSKKYVVQPSHSAAVLLLQRLRSRGQRQEEEETKPTKRFRDAVHRDGAVWLLNQAKRRIGAILEEVGLKVPEAKEESSEDPSGPCLVGSQLKTFDFFPAAQSQHLQLSKQNQHCNEKTTGASAVKHATEAVSEFTSDSCPFCGKPPALPFRSECSHVFCYWCVASHIDYQAKPGPLSPVLLCSICDKPIHKIRWA